MCACTHAHTDTRMNRQINKTKRQTEKKYKQQKNLSFFFFLFFFLGGGVAHSLPETTDPAQRQGTSELQTKISVLLNEIRFWKQ